MVAVIISASILWDPSNAPAGQDSIWQQTQSPAMTSTSASTVMEDALNSATILMALMNVVAERASVSVMTEAAVLM